MTTYDVVRLSDGVVIEECFTQEWAGNQAWVHSCSGKSKCVVVDARTGKVLS
jgi:hypothetical protein